MTSDNVINNKVFTAVDNAIKLHGETRDELIPILNEVNRSLGYLPNDALEEICRRLKSPKSSLFSVASFYHMFSTKPRGKHVIQFCESAPCHVVGGREIWQKLKSELELESGETSKDGKWTLITTSCLGLCGVGPVIVIDGDAYGNVKPEQIPDILKKYTD
jgi:NADH:ubiquinone oxidoreductase subunit E